MSDQTPPDEWPPAPGMNAPSGSPPPPPPDDALWSRSGGQGTGSAAPFVLRPPLLHRRRSQLLGAVAVLAAVGLVVGLFVMMNDDSSDDATGLVSGSDVVTTTTAAAPSTTEATAAPVTTVASASEAPATTASAPAATTGPSTTVAPSTTVTASTAAPGPAYPTLPDGSPEPIVAIFDGPTIRVTGWVPSLEKAAQLEALALANSTDPTAQVDSSWSVDPSVPASIGTRVIEMNSPRFEPGSSEVTPEHSEQLDRVANVMNLLPNVTVTVVGHADQVGDPARNYVLSEARAVSVVRYLVERGIDPSRLASRAVGEQDLLSEDESEASLALNRRTEFIFVGLLAD